MSIANQYRTAEFQQLLEYLISQYGQIEGLRHYKQWLEYHGYNETEPLMLQTRLKSTKKTSLIDLYKKSRTSRKAQEHETIKQLLNEAPNRETRKKLLVQLYGNMSLVEASMTCDRKDLELLAEIAEGKPHKETPQDRARRRRLLEEVVSADLIADPNALRKLVKKYSDDR